ncbi:MAG: endonuclease III [Holosporales bacterium]|jgi:endonuclease-3|nr:endonuclease III [Holosporales bacterium]
MRSVQEIEQIFEKFEEHEPNPKSELIYSTPFSFIVAVMLSAQATDKSVNKIMVAHLHELDSPEKILDNGIIRLTELIKSINIYKNKARYIYESAKIIIERFGGVVPLRFEDLTQLSGVGIKTANVVLNVLAGTGDIAVDTHVFRVSRRLGLSDADTPTQLNADLYSIVPQRFWNRVNHWLVLHGRYVCTAKRPKCGDCIVRHLCPGGPDAGQK